MNAPKSIFRQYDIRGLVGSELTPEFARGLGRAFASVGVGPAGPRADDRRRARQPALGRGARGRLRGGIVEAGATAMDVGSLPTPALYFGVAALGTDGGVQVTGSHNPPEFNGFKMVLGGEAFHGDEILGLWEIIVAERWRSGTGRETSDGSVLGRYREGIVSRHRLARPVRVVVDCGNGAGSLVAVGTLEALGAEVTPLFCESDGTFPNHHPDPTVPENLRDLQAACGAPAPSWASRSTATPTASAQWTRPAASSTATSCSSSSAATRCARFGPGTPVIFDVKCSEVLPAALAAAGARADHVEDRAFAHQGQDEGEGAPLAGEMSGHMFFGGDYLGFDDALFAAARLLEIVSRRPFGLAALLGDLPRTIATPEIRVDVPEERKFDLVERAVAHFSSRYPVNTIDGVRITFPRRLGAAPRVEHAADPRAPVRGLGPAVAGRRPRRGRRLARGAGRAGLTRVAPWPPVRRDLRGAWSSCCSRADGRRACSPIAGGPPRSRPPPLTSSPTGTCSTAC